MMGVRYSDPTINVSRALIVPLSMPRGYEVEVLNEWLIKLDLVLRPVYVEHPYLAR